MMMMIDDDDDDDDHNDGDDDDDDDNCIGVDPSKEYWVEIEEDVQERLAYEVTNLMMLMMMMMMMMTEICSAITWRRL